MGICGSKPKGFVGKRLDLTRKKRCRRRRTLQRRVSSSDRSFTVPPAFQARASTDVSWVDCTSVVESELDDDFYSVREDFSSVESFHSRREIVKNVDEALAGESDVAAADYCGLVSGNCLPCLPSEAKKRPTSPTTPRKRVQSKLSFKWRDGQQPSDLTFISSRVLHQRPRAGSTVLHCQADKRTPNCWSPIDPSTFKVRGRNYFRDKKKEAAPDIAAYMPFGVDVFVSARKVDHVARFVDLPAEDSLARDVPAILVVNIQVPLYSATIFQTENDGEGMSIVMYFKLSQTYSTDLPSNFRDSITRIINDEVERVWGFPVDTIAPFRERLKILGRVANLEDLQMSTAEKKLMNAYNEKPVLSRPQHEFYLGENYFEIDIDMHRFSYISRKGIEAFQERLKHCVLDLGLTIQGNKAEDYPEHILCCARINEIDYTKHSQLGL